MSFKILPELSERMDNVRHIFHLSLVIVLTLLIVISLALLKAKRQWLRRGAAGLSGLLNFCLGGIVALFDDSIGGSHNTLVRIGLGLMAIIGFCQLAWILDPPEPPAKS